MHIIIIGRMVRGSQVLGRTVPSLRFGLARYLSTKPNLSLLQTLPFPPTKFCVRSVLEKWTDEPVPRDACNKLFQLTEHEPGCGSLWSLLISVGTKLDRTLFTESIVDFILSNPTKHNSATINCALLLLIERGRFSEFHTLYKTLLSRLSETELQILAPNLIGLLSQSPMWNEAMDLIRLCDTSVVKYQTRRIINGAARYGSPVDVFSLLESLERDDVPPNAEFFNSFFRRFVSSNDAVNVDDTVNSLLTVLRNTHWSIPEESATILCDWFNQKPNWHAKLAVQLQRDECPVCECTLPTFELKPDSVRGLAEGFYQRAFKGDTPDDLYLTTTPAELKSLNRFLSDLDGPFDCVVDFLNLMHGFGIPFLPSKAGVSISQFLLRLHHSFNMRRFCLVGKGNKVIRHREFLSTIRNLGDRTGVSVCTFVTQSTSLDDIFMLYMALWSGPNCYLVSNDEFRQHRFTVGPDLNLQLSRWQAVRQIAVNENTRSYTNPVKCDTKVHGSMDEGWHVPYEDNSPRRSYVPPNTWLCAAPNRQSKTR